VGAHDFKNRSTDDVERFLSLIRWSIGEGSMDFSI